MSARLGVNVDHVATLRQARKLNYPDPVMAAAMAELAGAAQVTIHLREDRRHIQERDLKVLRETCQTLLNLEMAATQEMVKMAYEHKPDVVTLVPERREELTTEGGLDVNGQKDALSRVVKNLKDGDITVSMFIDPEMDQIKASHRISADRVELHTGRYCEARTEKDRSREYSRLIDAAKASTKLGMGCAAGHGLNYENVRPIARIAEIDELNIGHAIVARAVFVGFDRAVREMVELFEEPVKRALSAAEMRAVDLASARHGVPPEVLMLNAGTALAQEALSHASSSGKFVLVCGTGNNGGDGLVAAQALARANRRVFVVLVGDTQTLKGEPRRLFDAVARAQLPMVKANDDVEVGAGDVIVDALFGTGLSRAPAAEQAKAINQIARWRTQGAKVVSADVPSGLQCDTGQLLDPCVRADATVSFGLFKIGQLLEPGHSACGVQRCADIGLPVHALAAAQGVLTCLLEEGDAKGVLRPRQADTHKGTYGHVAVIAGSDGKSGAAALTGFAALKSGAGLVTIAARSHALAAALTHAPELMGHALPGAGALAMADFDGLAQLLEGKDAVVIGPGIPRGPETADLICALMKHFAVPWLLDADALNAFEGQAGRLKGLTSQLLLTPHPGEMARLLGLTTKNVSTDRLGAARRLASQVGATVVLKGARTVTADPAGTCFINPTGNAGMATGGSGDVLSGVCGALLAQGVALPQSAYAAVYAHGLAGDLRASATGQLGLVASDIVQGLSEVWTRWKL